MDQQVSPSYHIFQMVKPSYHSKVTPIGASDAGKMVEAVLLYVFRIAIPAFLFRVDLPSDRVRMGRRVY